MGAGRDAEAHRLGKGTDPHRSLAISAGRTHLHPEGALAVLHGGHKSCLCYKDWPTCRCCGTQRGSIITQYARYHLTIVSLSNQQLRKAIEDINSNSFVAHTCDDEVDGDTKPAVEKPLLSASASDKAVDMTITSMDSALSNSDNCSDIEMEHIKSLGTSEVTLTMPLTESNTTTDTNNTQNINKSV